MKVVTKNKKRHALNFLLTLLVSLLVTVGVVFVTGATGMVAFVVGMLVGAIAVQVQLALYPFEFEVTYED